MRSRVQQHHTNEKSMTMKTTIYAITAAVLLNTTGVFADDPQAQGLREASRAQRERARAEGTDRGPTVAVNVRGHGVGEARGPVVYRDRGLQLHEGRGQQLTVRPASE